MKFNLKKKISKLLVAALLAGIPMASAPAVSEAAGGWLGVAVSAISAGVQVAEYEKQMKYYNEDPQGRMEMFEALKAKQGVNNDPHLNARLDSLMTNLTACIATVDPTIYDMPYNYFINNDTTFNAACGLGHNMMVNTGMFNLVSNDSEIAVVLGHEMAHGQKDHVIKGFKKGAPYKVIAAAIGGAGGTAASLGAGVFANYTDAIVVTKPQEWEADNLAFDYLANSNYNIGACAAIWQRVMDKQSAEGSGNFVGEIFSPSDHPGHKERRDNYSKRMTEFSKNHVSVNEGAVSVNGKGFYTPVATDSMSSKERSYFLAGNLARIYRSNENPGEAYVSGGTVYMDGAAVITPVAGDKTASEIAALLNEVR